MPGVDWGMESYKRGSHTVWDCKYHLVWVTKYRYQVLGGDVGQRCRELLRETARAHEMVVHAGSINRDHVHMLLSIPPKYAVAQVVGYLKGKSAIHLARTYGGRQQNFVGEHFWARGYFVTTVGHDEEAVRRYIRAQEAEDRRLEQLELFKKK